MEFMGTFHFKFESMLKKKILSHMNVLNSHVNYVFKRKRNVTCGIIFTFEFPCTKAHFSYDIVVRDFNA